MWDLNWLISCWIFNLINRSVNRFQILYDSPGDRFGLWNIHDISNWLIGISTKRPIRVTQFATLAGLCRN
ncbi:MAG: hypothetical protein MJA27_08370 [Pseudanabaenales cyanobacterium]|nr:hypothetical protein [Pseudanabaenales cyanobacterium]